jgi:mono/diheme cytochrome c family protein
MVQVVARPLTGAVLAAMPAQQRIGIGIVLLLVAGWVAYGVYQLRQRPPGLAPGAEIELAPNRRPYFDDDALEGPRLERVLGWAFFLLVIIAVGLPLYWWHEPSRQVGATRGFDHRAAERGFLLFQPADSAIPTHNVGHFGCAVCHGSVGQGGAAKFVLSDPADPSKPPREVQWKVPALNTVLLRYSPDEVRTILVYGRAGTPMPAWGVKGGGPMGDQQIDDLVAYLQSVQLSPADARKGAVALGTDGARLFDASCSRCHTMGWSYGEPGVVGGGAYGWNLTGGDTLRQFPNPKDQIDFITNGVAFGKPYGVRGIGQSAGGGMPHFANMLAPEQIAAIVDYERSL